MKAAVEGRRIDLSNLARHVVLKVRTDWLLGMLVPLTSVGGKCAVRIWMHVCSLARPAELRAV